MHWFRKKIFILPFFLLFLFSCKKDTLLPDGQAEMALLDSVNVLRLAGCKCGNDIMPPVKTLVWNISLTKAAEAHAKDMHKRNYFEHISPEGTSPIQRAIEAGYSGDTVEENIGIGYSTIASVLIAWKASESHCKAMMGPFHIEMGAYSYNGYWVQEFGK